MKRLMKTSLVFAVMLAMGCASATSPAPSTATPAVPAAKVTKPSSKAEVVTLGSPSPMISLKVMVKAGSTHDPAGKEGLANLVADALVEGGFGDASNPVTKEKLAEITQPWGSGANPSSQVSNRVTTFHMTVPRDVLDRFLSEVLEPMLTSPLFLEDEVSRLKNEANATFDAVRYENLENLGLSAIDSFVNQGSGYEHQPFGSEEGVKAITRDDIVAFFEAWYRPENVVLGVSSSDSDVVGPIEKVVNALNSDIESEMPMNDVPRTKPFKGRYAVVIEEPNAPASSLHLGFPISINRTDADFWSLYVAQVYFGTHRDSFGLLYQQIRQERGYNYGDYAYIEHWNGRPFSLFQIFNQPREQQYFSIWIRPVGHEYAYHLTRAMTWELNRLIHDGLTEEQVAAAKKKAKVLYVNLAETVDRLLAAKMDDAFYGMKPGFLEGYLDRIDAVSVDDVNAAIRKHLQTSDVKYVLVTDAAHSDELVAKLMADQPEFGKTLSDYQLEQVELEDGTKVWQIPESKIPMIQRDGAWANQPLGFAKVIKAPVTSIFRTGSFIAD